ncbi:MAG: hypothetical protein ABI623_04615 [bacterium]
MGTVLDLIASTLFGTMLLMIILNANDMAAETQSVYNGDVLVQEMLVSTARLVEGEFRNMGFGVEDGHATVLVADTNCISFLTDLDRDGGVLDTITYSVGPVSEMRKTQNELDRYLYRKVNGGAPMKVGAVTVFKLQYAAASGEQLPTPVQFDRLSEIYVVEVTMEVQNPYAISYRAAQLNPGDRTAMFSSSLWQQTRLASQNSRR